MRRCCASGAMVATWAEWNAPVRSCAPALMRRSASARATSTFVWLSAVSSSILAPPIDLIPPAALMASTASCAPRRESCPTSAIGPETGSTMPTLIVRAWARSTAGKAPRLAEAPAAARRNVRRLTRIDPRIDPISVLPVEFESGTSAASRGERSTGSSRRSAGEGDADHAGGYDGGAEQTPAEGALLEQEASDQRRDNDGHLAPCHDVARLGKPEGEEHEEIAARAQHAGQQDRHPVLAPLACE